ncbi:MAG: hypothetical protein WCO00_14650 [Rhodospirillaceae bacterium]
MSAAQAFAIEVQGRSAGIVVAEQGGFVFFAADGAFRSLDRRVFKHVGQAEQAVVRLADSHGKRLAR